MELPLQGEAQVLSMGGWAPELLNDEAGTSMRTSSPPEAARVGQAAFKCALLRPSSASAPDLLLDRDWQGRHDALELGSPHPSRLSIAASVRCHTAICAAGAVTGAVAAAVQGEGALASVRQSRPGRAGCRRRQGRRGRCLP